MRDYAKVSPRFWTGTTGRELRAKGADCQLVALYLLTCPSSNMIGLYYLPIPTVAHETGMTLEGASKALRRVCDGVFAHYDEASETVWVVNMARDQIGEQLKPTDKQAIGAARALEEHRSSSLALKFHAHYREAFHLPPSKAIASPIEGPSMPPRSQEQEQEQEQEKNLARLPGERVPVVLVPDAVMPRFDIDALYRAYPRKQGKAKGIERLKSIVTSDADYQAHAAAIGHLVAHVKRDLPLDFVPHFSTWANGKWEDYRDGIPVPPRTNGKPAAPAPEHRPDSFRPFGGT